MLNLEIYFNKIVYCFHFILIENLSQKEMFNLNFPETQSHNFHLLEEQKLYEKLYVSKQIRSSSGGGDSTYIPIAMSFFLFLFSFSFVNYL